MTKNAWFIVPAVQSRSTIHGVEPDFNSVQIDGWSGTSFGKSSKRYLVRVYADADALDDLAAQPQTVSIDNTPTDRLNRITGKQRTAAGWSRAFRVE